MKPKLLDLFCKAGGAAMGYHRAGFEVLGVDIEPQKRFPFEFVQADALEYLKEHGHEFDAIHASPPCQAYSVLKHLTTKAHPQLVGPVRTMLLQIGKPFVIENVVGAPLQNPLMLCGSMFGLGTPCGAQLRRHRLFESNMLLMSPGPCRHGESVVGVYGERAQNPRTYRAEQREMTISVTGHTPNNHTVIHARRKSGPRVISITGHSAENPATNCKHTKEYRAQRTITVVGSRAKNPQLEREKYRTISVTGSTPHQNVERNSIRETFTIEEARIAMGIDWMVMKELSQAIPPAYTEWIGAQLIEVVR